MLRAVIALMVGGALMLAGCDQRQNGGQTSGSGAKASADAMTLGFLVKLPDEPWFQNEWKFAQRCADKYGFKLVKIGATDGEKVLSAIDNLGAQGAKGFVICTPDVRLGPAIVEKANGYGMKVFAVDDQFIGADGKPMDVPYMGISARAIGENVGKALYEEFKKRGWEAAQTGACAVTFDELQTGKERTDGATDSLVKAGFPAAQIFRTAEKTTDVPGAFEAADVLLTQNPSIKNWLVFSLNDEGVIGAVRALEGRGFNQRNVIAVGIGGDVGKTEFEKSEPTGFHATVLISPLRHGFETTELLYKWVKDGKEPPKDTRTEGILITRDNYKQILMEQGLLDSATTSTRETTQTAQR